MVDSDPATVAYRRNAAAVTDRQVSPPRVPRKRLLGRLVSPGTGPDPQARAEAEEVIATLARSARPLRDAVAELAALRRSRLLGKAEDELRRIDRAGKLLDQAKAAMDTGDFGASGKAAMDAAKELSSVGTSINVALGTELSQAAMSRGQKAALEDSAQRLREADRSAEQARGLSARAGLLKAAETYPIAAEGLALAAEVLGREAPESAQPRRARGVDADGVRVVSPHELETFADVGGLDEVKARLERTVRVILERSAEASGKGVVINGVLLYGPPGTGKTLLARAAAGEYGLRFIRFSPAAIASAYLHEPARKLRDLFAKAAASTPCLLFLDEIDAIAPRREGSALTADQREIVTQLLTSLEEYRRSPGLVIMAATNTLDHLDPALREGRFDVRIPIPLPDLAARRTILQVQLETTGLEIDWTSIDLDELAHHTAGRSGAALASIVAGASEGALSAATPLGGDELAAEIDARSGQDRPQTFEEQVSWDDVVLPVEIRDRLDEILLVFQKPDLGRKLGVAAPAGILLYGPPGTGKTTIAKALAGQVKASFYELSAAELLSKWVGESEQKIAQLFSRARANRPAIIFIDEIDALLKRRQSDSGAPWEERVVSQFLREMDGLQTGTGVLLVGATNRVDIIDEAIRDRRMVPIEVPLPTPEARRRLLEVLCRDVAVDSTVDLDVLARVSEGMSGADLKSLRNAAGMKALTRAAVSSDSADAAITGTDFAAALAERGVSLPARKRSARR